MNRETRIRIRKTISYPVACLVCALLAWGSLGAQQQEGTPAPPTGRGDQHSRGWEKALQLKGPPLPPKFPKVGTEIERVVLENGMVVYLQEDHRLPLLDAIVLVRTGTYYELPEELGTASLLGEVLRTGGTKNYPPETLEDRLDFIAANLNVSMQSEQGSVALNVPSKDSPEGLRILADVLRNPLFDASRLELAKRQAIFRLRASNESPEPIMRREFSRLLYTEAHPAGRTPTVEHLRQIQPEDLVRFYRKYFHPNQILLGLTGDFQKAAMLQTIRELFGDWPQEEVPLPPLPKANPQPKPGTYYVVKAATQSSLRLGHWGTNRDNPDRFAIELMDSILGGSDFSSRLGQRVRNNEGLAYDVGSYFPTSQRDISFFLVAAQTKTESTVQAIRSILDEIRKMTAGPVSKNEFETAQEMFLYSYVFRFAEPARAMTALMRLEYESLPSDYLEKEFQGYQAVTPQDIERVARKYLHPEQLTIFVVGDYPKIAAELAKLGPPHEVQPLQFDDPDRPASRSGSSR